MSISMSTSLSPSFRSLRSFSSVAHRALFSSIPIQSQSHCDKKISSSSASTFPSLSLYSSLSSSSVPFVPRVDDGIISLNRITITNVSRMGFPSEANYLFSKSFSSSPSSSSASSSPPPPSALSSPRTFHVLGLQQIAVGSLSKDRLHHLWVNLLGVPKMGNFHSVQENVDEDILSLGIPSESHPLNVVEVDLMAPINDSLSPKVWIPNLNHIGLWVDNIHLAMKELQEKGVRFAPGGIRVGGSGHLVCFIHPKGSAAFPLCGEGVLIELVQATENIIKEFNKHQKEKEGK